MKLNQYALYRVDKNKEGRELWHLSYQEARERKLPIRIESYRQMQIGELEKNEKIIHLWSRIKNQVEVSDVLVLNQNGEIACYYMSEEYPQRISGFIRLHSSGNVISVDTENYHIQGKEGEWIATDSIIIDGKQFFLMEHQVYRNKVAAVILDSYGKMVVAECNHQFDEKVKQQIHSYVNKKEQPEKTNTVAVSRLEHYQKFYVNGTYERSRESGTEVNYNMIDGQVNNQKKEAEKPKKKTSVLKKLREKQIAIAVRSGKPVPKYLEKEMERNRR